MKKELINIIVYRWNLKAQGNVQDAKKSYKSFSSKLTSANAQNIKEFC